MSDWEERKPETEREMRLARLGINLLLAFSLCFLMYCAIAEHTLLAIGTMVIVAINVRTLHTWFDIYEIQGNLGLR